MTIRLQPGRDAFGAIDIQPTFMPGGDLPTPDGEAVVLPINRLLEGPFAFRFATQAVRRDRHRPRAHDALARPRDPGDQSG